MRGSAVVADGVATLRLAAHLPPADWLGGELARVREDPSVRAVLLDARGAMPERVGQGGDVLDALARYDLPVVFAFEGYLDGSVAELALAADIRVCDTDSTVSFERRLGQWSLTRLRVLVGEGAAFRLFRAGEVLNADAMLGCGFVSEVTAAGEAFSRASRIAAVIASRGPIATRLAKEALWRGLEVPFAEGLRMETDLTLLLQTTKDRAEGVRAFLEKRPPQFTGE